MEFDEMKCELTELAKKHKTDKWGSHFYTPHYHAYFQSYQDKPVKVLEIGVGGYDDPLKGGESVRMWKEYFPQGKIVALDIYDKKAHEEERIKIYKGSQIDIPFLEKISKESGPFDMIIDDGSHINNHIIQSFKTLFPLLKQDGIYVVEDIQTSYWENYGGDSFNLKRKNTAMNFFKQLVDCVNYEEIDNPKYNPTEYDKNIVSVNFFHNMVFVQKGANNEGSNILKNNRTPAKNPNKAKRKYFMRKLKSYFTINE